jgi:Homeodomain-like domain
MVTVGVDARVVERRLAEGRLRCPVCSGRLAGWGHARERVVRGPGGIGWRLRPRRSRCWGCGVTHVLLPVRCLLRRADTAVVIWAALAASAGGAGHRKIAAALGCPASTVRGWLARFASRAGLVRGVFTVWLCALDPDPPPLAPAGSAAADAVAAVAAAAAAAGRRWAALVGGLSPGELASSVSAGRLLSPSWAPQLINTSPG